MDVLTTIRETLEDNCEKPDTDWIMLANPYDMSRMIYRRIKKDLGKTQEKLLESLENARTAQAQAEKREEALYQTVIELTERLKSQEVLDD